MQQGAQGAQVRRFDADGSAWCAWRELTLALLAPLAAIFLPVALAFIAFKFRRRAGVFVFVAAWLDIVIGAVGDLGVIRGVTGWGAALARLAAAGGWRHLLQGFAGQTGNFAQALAHQGA